MPRRVGEFTGWLRERGETAPAFVGDNWYEVERAAAEHGENGVRRAAFSLDELPPSDDGVRAAGCAGWSWRARSWPTRWTRPALLPMPRRRPSRDRAQDLALARQLGGAAAALAADDPVDRAVCGARPPDRCAGARPGRRATACAASLRLAIADDLRLADRLRGGGG